MYELSLMIKGCEN